MVNKCADDNSMYILQAIQKNVQLSRELIVREKIILSVLMQGALGNYVETA